MKRSTADLAAALANAMPSEPARKVARIEAPVSAEMVDTFKRAVFKAGSECPHTSLIGNPAFWIPTCCPRDVPTKICCRCRLWDTLQVIVRDNNNTLLRLQGGSGSGKSLVLCRLRLLLLLLLLQLQFYVCVLPTQLCIGTPRGVKRQS